MTDDTRTELRRGLENLVRESLRESADVDVSVLGPTVTIGGWAHFTQVEVSSDARDLEEAPPLTTDKQLALSVLVGEPDRAVLSALCDCLIEMGHEYAVECYEKGKRDGNPMAEAVKAMTPAVTAYADACRHLVNNLAARLAAPPAVTS